MKVVVLAGGISTERDVSLISGKMRLWNITKSPWDTWKQLTISSHVCIL